MRAAAAKKWMALGRQQQASPHLLKQAPYPMAGGHGWGTWLVLPPARRHTLPCRSLRATAASALAVPKWLRRLQHPDQPPLATSGGLTGQGTPRREDVLSTPLLRPKARLMPPQSPGKCKQRWCRPHPLRPKRRQVRPLLQPHATQPTTSSPSKCHRKDSGKAARLASPSPAQQHLPWILPSPRCCLAWQGCWGGGRPPWGSRLGGPVTHVHGVQFLQWSPSFLGLECTCFVQLVCHRAAA